MTVLFFSMIDYLGLFIFRTAVEEGRRTLSELKSEASGAETAHSEALQKLEELCDQLVL